MSESDQARDEAGLVKEILNGHKDHYRILVERYSPMVFHVVRRFEKDEDEVEELAQQIFVKAFEKLEQFAMKSKFSSWLYSVAFNHCRDYSRNIRRSNCRFSELEDDYLEKKFLDSHTPIDSVEKNEWLDLLKESLQKLASDYSEPFLLKYRDGLSYEVISERTGVSVGALKVRVHRARKQLKTMIEQKMDSCINKATDRTNSSVNFSTEN